MAALKGRLLIWYKLPDEQKPKISQLLIIMNHREKTERAQAPQLFAQVALTTSRENKQKEERGKSGRERQTWQVDFKSFNRGSGVIRFIFLDLTWLYQSVSVQSLAG